MKKIKILLLGIATTGIFNITQANQVFDLNVPAEIYEDTRMTFTLKPGSNFYTNNGTQVFAGETCYSHCSQYFVFWYNNKLYAVRNYNYGGDGNDYQGYLKVKINNIIVDGNTDISTLVDGGTSNSSFYSNDYGNADYLVMQGNFLQGYYCLVYTAKGESICWQSNFVENSDNLTIPDNNFNIINIGTSQDTLFNKYGQSNFTKQSITTGYPQSNIHCPTIGEVKKSYGLDKNVCYAGFNENDIYGDNSTFNGGNGLNIMEVYTLYSGGMNLQTRYDTYREYYKNINNNTNQFEGKSKALLGTQFARQTFGKGKTSYTILSYCNLELGNLPDNATTCTANQTPGSGQLTGALNLPVSEAQPTRQEMIENIINAGQQQIAPQTGTIYDDILEGEYNTRDIIESLNNVYTKITGIFKERGKQNGIIPDIITGLICLIVLFKLFKK